MMEYDLLRPWRTLDPWQKEYISHLGNSFLLTGRQVGKTTSMSIKAVELCIKHYKKGEYVLICSITEKQGYHLLAKALSYALVKYGSKIATGKDKPTKHIITFKNGTGILCYAAGETGAGLRGFTIKKLMIDEGSRMSEEFFIAVDPQLSVIGGTTDIASTPFGKLHKDGSKKYFYKCSLDKKFRKWYISAEDCPRHSKEFLEEKQETLSKLAYAQEYLAIFTDELLRLFDDEVIERACVLKRRVNMLKNRKYYIGCDVGALGGDDSTFEVIDKINNDTFEHVENLTERRTYTTQVSKKVINMDTAYRFKAIGIDGASWGFGVFSELLADSRTKYRVKDLNNASRPLDADGKKGKRLLKVEMYQNMLTLLENGKLKLLDDDDVIASLKSIQRDTRTSPTGKQELIIFGSNAHIAEGLIRGVWLAVQDRTLDLWAAYGKT